MGKSFNNIRVGKRFRLINFTEVSDFEVLEIMSNTDARLKDIHTLETYNLFDLIRYGKSEDFDLIEI